MQEQFRNELLQDRVYVFTPLSKVIDLPKGATPVDFTYTLCIPTSATARAAPRWTGSIAQGRLLLERELQRLGVNTVDQEKVAHRLRFHKLEELLAALGCGETTSRSLSLAIQQEFPAKPAATPRSV